MIRSLGCNLIYLKLGEANKANYMEDDKNMSLDKPKKKIKINVGIYEKEIGRAHV